jgi:hypothetical protein
VPKLNLEIGEETGRHPELFHEHSITIQVFEISHFEFTPILRMLQGRLGVPWKQG